MLPFYFLYERLLERRIQRSQTPSHLLLVLNEVDILPDETDETDETDGTEKTGRIGKTGKTERTGRGVFGGGGRKEQSGRRGERGERRKKRSGFDGAEKLRQFVRWCHSLRIEEVSIYIGLIREANGRRLESALLENACERIVERVSEVLRGEDAFVAIYAAPHDSRFYARFFFGGKKTTAKECEGRKRKIIVSVGLGGKSELTRAFRALATKVRSGEIEPAEIDEKMLEDALIFKSEPELIIRSGSTRLTDFLIWQSVYSELYFTDVNWRKFRRIDLLRAVRDFQMRERRFGR